MNQKHPQGFRPDVQTQQYSEENGHFSREKKCCQKHCQKRWGGRASPPGASLTLRITLARKRVPLMAGLSPRVPTTLQAGIKRMSSEACGEGSYVNRSAVLLGRRWTGHCVAPKQRILC